VRTSIENWLLRHWYSTDTPPWYLRSMEPLYRSAWQRARKRQLARITQDRTDLPLIVVGNITAGGSGKTPLVIRLCQLAGELGLKAGVASTGYGRKSRETRLVKTNSDPRECGDEPILLAHRTGVPVVVAAIRRDAVQALNTMGLDLIVSDDGLQHLDLGADIEICVVDGQRGLGNGHLIPAGPLREPALRLSDVDYVVSNGIWEGRPTGLTVEVMELEALSVQSLDGDKSHSLEEFLRMQSGKTVHAFAGIGNPKRFFDMLLSMGFECEENSRSDHHTFSNADFKSVPQGASILMTEKDAVKCRALGLKDAWYIPVETLLSTEFERILKNQLLTLTKESPA
jgi:tetraacyldisaccharide 4'-kinase